MLIFFALFLTLPACKKHHGDNDGSPPLPPAPEPTKLGDIQAEVSYFQTKGQGTIDELLTTDIPDPCCFAAIVGDRRFVLLHPNFYLLPLHTQRFFLAHEYGHHYLRHHATVTQGWVKEYEADAYGIRVAASLYGQEQVEKAIEWIANANSPGDATHPPSEQRAIYLAQVIAAFSITPTAVPTAPAGLPAAINGRIVVTNLTNEPGLLYINYSPFGVIAIHQRVTIDLPPGTYRLDLQGQISGAFYIPAFVSLIAGQTVNVP